MTNLIFILLFIIAYFIIMYLFFKINKLQRENRSFKKKLFNLSEENKQLPKKQTGFGTDRSKDEHTVNDHDIYHY
jgi:hypothetical protein